jgi:Tol biopolymer transport system component
MTQETFANQPGVMYNGTWQPAGTNKYLVTRDNGSQTVWVYSPDTNTVAKQSAPGIIYSLYQGSTNASAAAFSGNGSTVIPFTAPSSGLWTFTLKYTGESNYIVWLTDSMGSRVALLANSIGTSSAVSAKKLSDGKYYLDVNASGPWTIQTTLAA